MRRPPSIQRVELPLRPLDVLAAWPLDRPLLALRSEPRDARTDVRGRWSIFAEPSRWLSVPDPAPGDPLAALDARLRETALPRRSGPLPFPGGWIGFLSYELGAVIEPAARCRRRPPGPWPLLEAAWCPSALLHDGLADAWYAVGRPAILPALTAAPAPDPPRIGAWSSSLSPDAYLAAVRRILEDIAAGDIFQANLAQRLSAPFRGSTRALARRALDRSGAHLGAYLELPEGRTIVSMSPELFLEMDGATRTVATRPIKGTRPVAADPGELLASEKDAAELNMIVDLMRNDLGRVCAFGSVRVARGREIESHATVHHGVAEVVGRLRDDVTPAALLRAAFPAGSITGAPKIRAMQIIDTLEPVARGPYCGSIGYFADHGSLRLNVAIRTIHLHGARPPARWDVLDGTIAYGVGGGIVADSDPVAEFRECGDKAQALWEAVTPPDRAAAPASR